MKKILFLTLSLILMFSLLVLASCNKDTESKTDATTTTNNSTAESTADSTKSTTDDTTEAEDVLLEDEVNMKITGYVVDEYNNPVAGAKVIVGDKSTLSKEDGSYSLTVLRASAFDITATKDGYFSGDSKDVNEAKLKTNPNLLNVQVLKKHYVKGNVVDGADPKNDGSFGPAKGAVVFIETDKKYSAEVKDDGTYELEFAATPFTDIAVLFFEYKGYANTYRFVSVEKAKTKDAAVSNIAVAPNTTFSGKVTVGGKPAKNAVIKIQPKIDTSAAHNPAVKTLETIIYTDENGNYKSSDKQFVFYSTEYNVILEVRDLFGNATNEKGEKVRQVIKTVKVTDSRDFTVNFEN